MAPSVLASPPYARTRSPEFPRMKLAGPDQAPQHLDLIEVDQDQRQGGGSELRFAAPTAAQTRGPAACSWWFGVGQPRAGCPDPRRRTGDHRYGPSRCSASWSTQTSIVLSVYGNWSGPPVSRGRLPWRPGWRAP